MLTLYRAVYQPTNGSPRPRGMTFAAQDAQKAAAIAEDWQLPGDVLLVVKPLRKLTEQFNLQGVA
jgi:hypothetical protein